MNDLGHVKACHQPRNERCPHNADPMFDCTCRPAEGTVKNRKPYREVTMHVDKKDLPHGCRPEIVMQVHTNGTLVFRELGRRQSSALATNAADVYGMLVNRAARRIAFEKKRARKARKGGRK